VFFLHSKYQWNIDSTLKGERSIERGDVRAFALQKTGALRATKKHSAAVNTSRYSHVLFGFD
jgi:hypothetical protein